MIAVLKTCLTIWPSICISVCCFFFFYAHNSRNVDNTRKKKQQLNRFLCSTNFDRLRRTPSSIEITWDCFKYKSEGQDEPTFGFSINCTFFNFVNKATRRVWSVIEAKINEFYLNSSSIWSAIHLKHLSNWTLLFFSLFFFVWLCGSKRLSGSHVVRLLVSYF